MNSLFQYIVETTLILGVFLLFFEGLLKKERSFQYNRFYLLFAPIFAAIIPLLEIPFIPGFEQTESLGFVYELPTVVTGVTTIIEPESKSLPDWVWAMYLAVAGGLLIRLLVQLMKLFDIITYARKKITAGDHTLVIASEPLPTFAFMSYIVVGSDKNVDEEAIVHSLNHERVHIRQKHSVDVIIIELLGIIFWFNPFLYYYKRIIRENHEFLADQQASKEQPLAYSLALLKEIQKGTVNAIPNYFSMHFTKKRLKMISGSSGPFTRIKPVVTIPVIVLVFVTFSCKNEFLEQQIEPSKTVNEQFFYNAPAPFAGIMQNLKAQSPEKSFFFKVVDDIDLEIVKANHMGYKIEHYEEILFEKTFTFSLDGSRYSLDRTTEGVGMIYSSVGHHMGTEDYFIFDEKVYSKYEITHMPEPWLGWEHLIKRVASYTYHPTIDRDKNIQGPVTIRFVVNPYGNIIQGKPIKHELNTDDVHIANQFYGRALEAIRSLDGYFKPGELNDNKVNVEMELTVYF